MVVAGGQVDVLLENGEFVPGIFVETNFADAKNVWALEKFGDELKDFTGEAHVLGLFWIDAQPAVMRELMACSALWFVIRELAEIIVKTVSATAIEAGPEGGFAHRGASCGDHGFIVIGGATDHVGVRLDVAHGREGSVREKRGVLRLSARAPRVQGAKQV